MDIKVIASGSSGNATLISDGVTSLLLDAGITIKQLQIGTDFKLSKVSGCLITHAHKDHSRACKELAKMGISVYSSNGTFAEINAVGHRFKAVKSLDVVTIGTFIIVPFDVIHDATEPLGFLVESIQTGEKLIYFTDTAYVKYTFSGLTHIISECNHGEYELRQSVANRTIEPELAKRITKNHLSVERLIVFLKMNNLSQLKEIHLVHLSDNNSDEKRFKQEVQRATGVATFIH